MNDDLISRQAAIKAVHDEFDECLVWDESGRTTADEVEMILDGLPPAEPGWIPCSERLPAENEGEVLVYLYNPPTPYIAWVRDGHWLTEDFEVEKDYDPDAWMPLPKPYERSEDDME